MKDFTQQVINAIMVVVADVNTALTTFCAEKNTKKMQPVVLKVKTQRQRVRK